MKRKSSSSWERDWVQNSSSPHTSYVQIREEHVGLHPKSPSITAWAGLELRTWLQTGKVNMVLIRKLRKNSCLFVRTGITPDSPDSDTIHCRGHAYMQVWRGWSGSFLKNWAEWNISRKKQTAQESSGSYTSMDYLQRSSESQRNQSTLVTATTARPSHTALLSIPGILPLSVSTQVP